MSEGSDDDMTNRGQDDSKEGPLQPSKKKTSKSIRVLTVLAYMLSVSLAAILLSLYYVFLWEPKVPGAMRRVSGFVRSSPCQQTQSEGYNSPTPPIIQYLTRPQPSSQAMVESTHDNMK